MNSEQKIDGGLSNCHLKSPEKKSMQIRKTLFKSKKGLTLTSRESLSQLWCLSRKFPGNFNKIQILIGLILLRSIVKELKSNSFCTSKEVWNLHFQFKKFFQSALGVLAEESFKSNTVDENSGLSNLHLSIRQSDHGGISRENIANKAQRTSMNINKHLIYQIHWIECWAKRDEYMHFKIRKARKQFRNKMNIVHWTTCSIWGDLNFLNV